MFSSRAIKCGRIRLSIWPGVWTKYFVIINTHATAITFPQIYCESAMRKREECKIFIYVFLLCSYFMKMTVTVRYKYVYKYTLYTFTFYLHEIKIN